MLSIIYTPNFTFHRWVGEYPTSVPLNQKCDEMNDKMCCWFGLLYILRIEVILDSFIMPNVTVVTLDSVVLFTFFK